ncbi:MAG: hypothetical protein GC159_04990 [Phycisphaera sp.]|nr:hypothetical protein [Phycisphaera sp.]
MRRNTAPTFVKMTIAAMAVAVVVCAGVVARAEDEATSAVKPVERDGYVIRFDTLDIIADYRAGTAGVATGMVTLQGHITPPGSVDLSAYRIDLNPNGAAGGAAAPDRKLSAEQAFERRWKTGGVTRIEYRYRGRNNDDADTTQPFGLSLYSKPGPLPGTIDARTGEVRLLEVLEHEAVDVPLQKSDAMLIIADGLSLKITDLNVSPSNVSVTVTDAKRGKDDLLSFGVPPFVWRHGLINVGGAAMQMYNANGNVQNNGRGNLYYSFDNDEGKPESIRFDIATRVTERTIPLELPAIAIAEPPAAPPVVIDDAKPDTPTAAASELDVKLAMLRARTQLDLTSGRREHLVTLNASVGLKDEHAIAIGRVELTHLLDDQGKPIAFEPVGDPSNVEYQGVVSYRGRRHPGRQQPSINASVRPEHLPQNIATIAGYVTVLTATKRKVVSEEIKAGQSIDTGGGSFDIKSVKQEGKTLTCPASFTAPGSPMQIYDDRAFVLEYYALDEHDQRWNPTGFSGGWSTQQDGSTTGNLDLRFTGEKEAKPKSINFVVVTETKVEKLPFVIRLVK